MTIPECEAGGRTPRRRRGAQPSQGVRVSTKTGLVAHGDAAVALGSDRAVGLWILSVQAPRTTLMRVVALKIQRRGRTRSSLRVDASRTDGRLDRQERRRTRPTCGYQMPRTIMRPACRPRARVACTNADGWSRVSPVSAALVGYPTRRGWLPAPRGGSQAAVRLVPKESETGQPFGRRAQCHRVGSCRRRLVDLRGPVGLGSAHDAARRRHGSGWPRADHRLPAPTAIAPGRREVRHGQLRGARPPAARCSSVSGVGRACGRLRGARPTGGPMWRSEGRGAL